MDYGNIPLDARIQKKTFGGGGGGREIIMFAVGEGSEAFLVNLLCEFNKISRWVPDTIQPTLSSRSAHGTCTAGFCFYI